MKQIAILLATLSTAALAQQAPNTPTGGMGTPDGSRSGPSMLGNDLNPGPAAPGAASGTHPTRHAKPNTHKAHGKTAKRS